MRGWIGYLLAAALLGVLWYVVVFEVQITSEEFWGDSRSGREGLARTSHPLEDENTLLLGSAMVITSCLIAAGSFFAIRRVHFATLIVTAPLPMFVGAGIFSWVLLGIGFPFNDVNRGFTLSNRDVVSLLALPFIGVWIAGAAWKVTVPLAIVSVLALRGVSRLGAGHSAAVAARG